MNKITYTHAKHANAREPLPSGSILTIEGDLYMLAVTPTSSVAGKPAFCLVQLQSGMLWDHGAPYDPVDDRKPWCWVPVEAIVRMIGEEVPWGHVPSGAIMLQIWPDPKGDLTVQEDEP